jgi:hypothetical protein
MSIAVSISARISMPEAPEVSYFGSGCLDLLVILTNIIYF